MANITLNFFKNSTKYGLGIFISRVGSIITLPVFFHYLSFEDFGIISIFQAIQSILTPVLSLCLSDGVSRFYFEWDVLNRPVSVYSIWIFSIFFSLIGCILFFFFGHFISHYLFNNDQIEKLWPLIVASLFLNNLSLIPLVIIKADEEINKFNTLNLISFVLTSSIALLLIIEFQFSSLGFILANICSSIILASYFIYFILSRFKSSFNFNVLSPVLKYSIPLLPAALIDNFYNSIEKYSLNRMFDLNILGIYDLGNRFGSVIGSVNQALKSVWVPMIFSLTSNDENNTAAENYSKLSFFYILFMSVFSFGVYLFADLILIIFDNKAELRKVLSFFPIIILIYFVQSTATALGRGIDISKKTSFSALIPIFGILVFYSLLHIYSKNISLYSFLIILLFANIFRSFLQIFFSFRFYNRPWYLSKYIKLFVISFIFILGNELFQLELLAGMFLFVSYCIVLGLAVLDKKTLKVFSNYYESWYNN